MRHPRQALEVASFRRFDVALVDESLPEIDGVALSQRLQRLIAELQVILLTEPADCGEGPVGAYRCLLKPCEPRRLAEAIAGRLLEP